MLELAKRYLSNRRTAYQRVFARPDVDVTIVLDDLAKFCRAHDSTFHVEHSASAVLEGRREVWLRIAHHLNLTEEQIWELYGNRTLSKE